MKRFALLLATLAVLIPTVVDAAPAVRIVSKHEVVQRTVVARPVVKRVVKRVETVRRVGGPAVRRPLR